MILRTVGHLHQAFEPYEKNDTLTEAQYNLSCYKFDVIVVTGTSGMVLGSILAHMMNKKLAVVRRKCEINYTVGNGRVVEGWLGGDWIFFDDLICSGGTRRYARSTYIDACINAGEKEAYQGTYLFSGGGYFQPNTENIAQRSYSPISQKFNSTDDVLSYWNPA